MPPKPKLLYYNSPLIHSGGTYHHLPGVKRFSSLFKLVNDAACFNDRSIR